LPPDAPDRARIGERDGITRRYVRASVRPRFLSPELVEAIRKAGNPSNSP